MSKDFRLSNKVLYNHEVGLWLHQHTAFNRSTLKGTMSGVDFAIVADDFSDGNNKWRFTDPIMMSSISKAAGLELDISYVSKEAIRHWLERITGEYDLTNDEFDLLRRRIGQELTTPDDVLLDRCGDLAGKCSLETLQDISKGRYANTNVRHVSGSSGGIHHRTQSPYLNKSMFEYDDLSEFVDCNIIGDKRALCILKSNEGEHNVGHQVTINGCDLEVEYEYITGLLKLASRQTEITAAVGFTLNMLGAYTPTHEQYCNVVLHLVKDALHTEGYCPMSAREHVVVGDDPYSDLGDESHYREMAVTDAQWILEGVVEDDAYQG